MTKSRFTSNSIAQSRLNTGSRIANNDQYSSKQAFKNESKLGESKLFPNVTTSRLINNQDYVIKENHLEESNIREVTKSSSLRLFHPENNK